MNLARLLTDTSKRIPEHTAVVFGDQRVTFGELNARVDRLVRGFGEKGISPGDKCVLMMPNSITWIECYYALAKLGATVVPVNFLYHSGELTHIFRDSGAKALIGHGDHLEYAAQVAQSSPDMSIFLADGQDLPPGFTPLSEIYQDEGAVTMAEVDPKTPLAIIYTSGTTGLPKGAVLTHQNLAGNARTVADMRHTEPDDVVLGVLPFFHIYGQTSVLNASIYLGLTIRLWEHFEDTEVLAAIDEDQSTILIAVPTIYNRLAELAAARPPENPGLRFCISGGASLPVEVLRRFEKFFGTTIYEGYGLTECSPVCIENPYGQKTKPGSIGVPIPGFEARVVDNDDNDVPRGEVGELIVRGPGVMKEYLGNPGATAETLRGGWLHTGDLARQDEDGYIYIVDRKKELIIRGGYNVYPREIEEVLYRHPAVLECAVIGLPHADLGEEVAAVVVLRPGVETDEDDVRRFAKNRVAPYKYPRIIKIVKDLPKTHTGKILKRAITGIIG